jgi:hypothetical protein
MSDLVIPRWLRKSPSAIKVRATLEDGSERMVPVGDPKDPRRWSKCRDVLVGLRAVKVEKLDKGGDVVGVMLLEDEDQAEERQAAAAKKKQSDETQLVQLARLLKEAANEAAERHADAYTKAFDMMAGMAKGVLEAHNKQVTLINGILRRVENALTQSDPGGGDQVGSMLGQLVMGQMGIRVGPGGAPPHANGVPPVAPAAADEDDDA